MKRILIVLFLLTAVVLAGCGGSSGGGDDESAIHNLLNTFSAAMKSRDASRFDRILADVLTVVDDEGATETTKENQIAAYQVGMIFVTSVSKYDFTERNIIINGDTAVVECRANVDMQTAFGPSVGSGPARFEAMKFANGWRLTVIDQRGIQHQ